ncbi:desmoglein-4 precursor [Rattus norvegicus]|uniref:Desmoglein-4 n=1 Tax=Rattus norvegicus TaxID=10116 RepID=DSG4_RAT|nr:desmoglein-4 precursor [Rattus norvegicus]Q6W3B0.1 RecName: Full=Desmoglein-4; Flags: Precursor [Rattus norvegicus]AAQ88398.1 desmoglein 4 [Rattus norvegicus]|eukprot:NP_955784.1 desmoglein-4 precursor [Rattus norvegicus]
MDWLLFRNICLLILFMVVLGVNSEFIVEVKELDIENGTTTWQTVRRQKREWIKFAAACREGEDNSKRNPIARIRSDCEVSQRITYRISGAGIDRPPYGVFTINPRTGEINITSVVDREITPLFLIHCRALNSRGEDLERPLELRVKVMDVNDNPPVFTQNVYTANIEENSDANALVVKLSATDADEDNHLNSKIAYKIISQEPAGAPMFMVNRYTGEVRTMSNFLDREQHSMYNLLVRGSDRDGATDGLSSECDCRIKILDVNDNFPILEKTSYSASIEENCLSSELIRLQAIDLDEEGTDNWLAQYSILSGNDGNWFEIQTDPKTNEGILKLVKMLDYEQEPNIYLSIGVRNQAEFHHSVASQFQMHSTPVRIQVINVREGPTFRPSSMTFSLRGGMRGDSLMNYVLGTYTAIDMDTGSPATNVRYVIGHDAGSWLKVDSRTGEIQFSREFDTKSKYITDGMYAAEILAIDDGSGRTATGTICIEVPDANDYCPVIYAESRSVCTHASSVRIYVNDHSFGAPFTFCVVDESPDTADIWDIRSINGTSAILMTEQTLSPGPYQIPILVKDSHNRACELPQTVLLDACLCDDYHVCLHSSTTGIYTGDTIWVTDDMGTVTDDGLRQSNVGLGPAGIGMIILGLLLLFLSPLLLLMCCCKRRQPEGLGTRFAPVPEGGEGVMQPWRIEGAHPEDRDVSNICVPMTASNTQDRIDSSEIYTNTYAGGGTVEGGVSGVELNTGVGTAAGIAAGGATGTLRKRSSTIGTLREYQDTGMNMAFLDSYFSEKAYAYADEDEGRPANDCLLIYDHEGTGSPVGSIGCCSWIVDDLDESYMETLDPKFRTLAEICLDTEIEPFPSHQACIPISTDLPLLGPNYFVNESSGMTLSEAEFQAEMAAASEPMIHGDIIVTETYTATDPCVQPTTIVFDSQLPPNVVVTETVMAPVYDVQGNICVPAEIANTHNVYYAERVVASPGVPDMGNGNIGDTCIGPVMSGGILVGPEIQVTQMMSPDIHISQTTRSTSPMTSQHRVTRYSNIHYSRQ